MKLKEQVQDMVLEYPEMSVNDVILHILTDYCLNNNLTTRGDVLLSVYKGEFPNTESIKRYYKLFKK